eukprot:193129_1
MPLWIIDLALTIYLVIEFYNANIFACCTTNQDPWSDICGYDDLGGAGNVFVDDYGYCKRFDDESVSCMYTGECAEVEGIVPLNTTNVGSIFGDTMCNEDVLTDVANCNWFWLTAILITKSVGLVFLIALDIKSCCSKIDPAEEEAKQVETCWKCKKWGKQCCCSTIKLLIKLTFLLFGTVATFCALYYMQLTGHVTTSSCSCVPEDLESICTETAESCMPDNENYYAVVFDNVDLGGPYWADVVSNILSTVIWIVRIAVMRYALKTTHLAD